MSMQAKQIRILFMGTPSLSSSLLKWMIEEKYNIIGVISQPDRERNRKGELLPTPTKLVANEYGINVYQIDKLKDNYSFILDLKPDLILTIAYGQIVPHDVLKCAKYGALNLHGSLLPKYRGASPIQSAILHGEKETAMSLMEMVDKMDAGRVYYQKNIVIDDEDNTSTLLNKMFEASKYIIANELQNYLDGKLIGIEQDESLVTYAHMIKREDEKINLDNDISFIHNQIRALADDIGAYLIYNGLKIKIFKAMIYNRNNTHPIGTIIASSSAGLLLQCKDGVLAIIELQLQGKKRMSYKDFINGNKAIIGTTLQ